MATVILKDLESAEVAYGRVRSDSEAIAPSDLATMNVDLVTATSLVLGVAERVMTFRDRATKLPEFDVRNFDRLTDYAKACWFVYISNLPTPEPADAEQLIAEVAALRGKLMMWALPLVGSGVFDLAAYNKIREGSGYKDAASDLVALVGLYRAKWDQVKGICGVNEQDLNRGAEIGPAVFALVSRRENQLGTSASDGTLRVRRVFTLLDRAYAQCRRAIRYLCAENEDVDTIAPSLRRNAGTRPAPTAPTEPEPEPTDAAVPTAPVRAALEVSPGPSVGGGASPFVAHPS